MSLLYVLLAIVLLGVLIMVHELGHFMASRLCGIAVKEFSIGFGPKLLQWKSKKHETLFSIRPIPLGGYCMFYGDTDDDPQGYTKWRPLSDFNDLLPDRYKTGAGEGAGRAAVAGGQSGAGRGLRLPGGRAAGRLRRRAEERH